VRGFRKRIEYLAQEGGSEMKVRTCSGKKKRNVLREKACELWGKRNGEEEDDLYLWLDNKKAMKSRVRKIRPKNWL
jgi:hypothetical protein